jgi:PhnB protein
MHLNPYVIFDGNCRVAMEFYAEVLGGKILAMMTFADMPGDQSCMPENRELIAHTRLAVGDEVLMASDAPTDRFEKPQGFYVTLSIKEPAEAERVYNALAEGGTVMMPIGETFWAQKFAMLKDRFGTPWMINCERPNWQAQAGSAA